MTMTNDTNFPILLNLVQNQEDPVKNDLSLTLTLPKASGYKGKYYLSVYRTDTLYYVGTTVPRTTKTDVDPDLFDFDDDDDNNMGELFRSMMEAEQSKQAAHEDESQRLVRVRRNKLLATVPSDCIWMPGEYFVLVMKLSSWMQRIDFVLDDNLIAWPTGQHFFLLGSSNFLLTHKLTIDDPQWLQLSTYPGAVELRRRYLKSEVLKELNAERELHNLRKVNDLQGQWGNLILVTNQVPDYRIVDIISVQLTGKGINWCNAASLYNAASNTPYEELSVLDSLGSDNLCLYNISTLMGTGGKIITAKLEEKLRDGTCNIILVASEAELQQLFEVAPSMQDFFLSDSRIEMHDASCFEMMQMMRQLIFDEGLSLTPQATKLLQQTLVRAYEQGYIRRWTKRDLHRFVLQHISAPFLERMLQRQELGLQVIGLVEDTDIDTSRLLHAGQSEDEMLRRLNQMVGLHSVKQSITTMTHRMRFYAERRRLGLHTTDEAPHHAIFVGSPGTGKTTVARLLGKIYHSLGMLSKGDVVCVDRARIVGRYIGETEENMKQILSEARGNVLFVDEAYALYSGDSSNDFGRCAMTCLLPVLAQKNPDMLVIFAGYEKEMDALMSMNPGMLGRFPYKFRFDDYNADELMQIALMQLQRDEYTLSPEAEERLNKVIRETVARRTRNFANARWVEQLVQNGLLPAMADRLAASQLPLTRESYQRIELQDVEAAYEQFSPLRQQLTRSVSIGFCA